MIISAHLSSGNSWKASWVYSIDKVGPLLCFVYLENSPESMHLRTADKDELDGEVLRLSSEGKSMREIACMTGKSKSTVHRIIQDAARKGCVPSRQMGHAGQMGQKESEMIDEGYNIKLL